MPSRLVPLGTCPPPAQTNPSPVPQVGGQLIVLVLQGGLKRLQRQEQGLREANSAETPASTACLVQAGLIQGHLTKQQNSRLNIAQGMLAMNPQQHILQGALTSMQGTAWGRQACC